MNGKKSHALRILIYFIAFVALVAVAVILAVSKIVPATNTLSGVLKGFAGYIAYAFLILSSLWYVMSKRGIVLKIVWVICSIGIVVLLFI